MKSYTDLEQSRKLAEILPLESADMYYACGAIAPDVMIGSKQDYECYTMCWSLSALLGVLPYPFLSELTNKIWKCGCYPSGICYYVTADSAIDACYEMIIKLYELKML